MLVITAVALFVSGCGIVNSRPQSRHGNFLGRGSSLRVDCRLEEYPPGSGKYDFICGGIDPKTITHTKEHFLTLNAGGSNKTQAFTVVVPNYRHEHLIRANVKGGGASGNTSFNILLKKPEVLYDVQAQHGASAVHELPQVNLEYEPLPPPESIHYPTDQKYRPVTATIRP